MEQRKEEPRRYWWKKLEKLEGFSVSVFLGLSILTFVVLFGLSFVLSGENSLDVMEETVYIVRDSIWGNLLGIGIFLALGVGITQVPGCLAGSGFPDWVTTVFGSSSVVVATLMAILLNLILPKDRTERKAEEK